ncbi:MAG: response regulator, partial [Desulfatitalea sp.]|nr:response regulator [Desulfatitalea sp.]
ADTGIGMSAEIHDRLFHPYFTTKPPGKGSGLGLSVVHGIVKSYNGEIRVESTLGQGALFEVFLPAHQNEYHDAPYDPSVVLPTGTERILLVDDEAPIVRLQQQVLERLGYRVVARTSSMETHALFKADPEGFDVLITDMTMPVMTGDQLAKAILSIRPNLPVIICTGFSERLTAETICQIGIKGYLMKPVSKSEMAHLLRQVLDEPQGLAQK